MQKLNEWRAWAIRTLRSAFGGGEIWYIGGSETLHSQSSELLSSIQAFSAPPTNPQPTIPILIFSFIFCSISQTRLLSALLIPLVSMCEAPLQKLSVPPWLPSLRVYAPQAH